jgi:CubicO group peptidase (beta-lactamase class C family)
VAGCSTPVPLADVARHADAVVDQAAARASFNGAVVLMRDGQVVYQRGVGLAQRNPDRPYTPATVSDGASLAKTLTAATLWDLADDGRCVGTIRSCCTCRPIRTAGRRCATW